MLSSYVAHRSRQLGGRDGGAPTASAAPRAATPVPAARAVLSLGAAVAVLAGLLTGVTPLVASAAPPSPASPSPVMAGAGGLVSLAPTRILDTRSGNGGTGPVAARATLNLQVTGRGGVPATGVAAVVLNLTVTQPTTAGNLTAYPTGSTAPTVSNLNFVKSQTIPNLAVLKLGNGGKVSLVNNSSGTVHLVADVAGYYLAGTPSAPGAYAAASPSRILDTRTEGPPVAARAVRSLQVTGQGGIPASGVAAVVVNLTVTQPTTAGNITAYPAGGTPPTASNLNFVKSQTIPNLAIVRLGADGQISLANNSSGTVHLIADVAGYFLDGAPTDPGSFAALDPSRILDTRTSGGAPVAARATLGVQVTGRGGIPTTGVSAVVLNITVTRPTAAGNATAYPAGSTAPTASNLNFVASETIPNLAVVKVGSGGRINLANNSPGSVHLVIDVAGYLTPATWGPGAYLATSLPAFTDGSGTAASYPEVACSTPTSCVAIRSAGVDVSTLGASGWVATTLPNPPDRNPGAAYWEHVACAPDGTCVAIGWDSWGPILGTRTSGGWQVAAPPYPAETGPNDLLNLADVDCGGAGSCAVVGSYTIGAGASRRAYAATLGSGSWSLGSVPVPGDAGAGGTALDAVSCGAVSGCTATGSTPTTGGTLALLIATQTGTAWSVGTTAFPAELANGVQVATVVDCPTASACATAVTSFGDGTDNGTEDLAFVGTLSGTAAALSAAPPVSGAVSRFTGIECAEAGRCFATGSSVGEDRLSAGSVLMTELAAGVWTNVAVPLPPGVSREYTQVSHLACIDAVFCLAVAETSSGPVHLARTTGGWTALLSPATGVSSAAFVTAMDCVAPGPCVGLGDAYTATTNRAYWVR